MVVSRGRRCRGCLITSPIQKVMIFSASSKSAYYPGKAYIWIFEGCFSTRSVPQDPHLLPLCVICCTTPLLYFCTVLHNCSNARVRCKISCWYSYKGKQGLKLIFKPNSINCFVLARNPASMLQIRNGTYQNVPRSSSYTFRYFVSSSAVSDVQKFSLLDARLVRS